MTVVSRTAATRVAPTANAVTAHAAKEPVVQQKAPDQSAELAESPATVPSIEPLVLTPLVRRLPKASREQAGSAASATVKDGSRDNVTVRRKPASRTHVAVARETDSALEEPSERAKAAPSTAPQAASAASETTAASTPSESAPAAAPSPDRAGNEPLTE